MAVQKSARARHWGRAGKQTKKKNRIIPKMFWVTARISNSHCTRSLTVSLVKRSLVQKLPLEGSKAQPTDSSYSATFRSILYWCQLPYIRFFLSFIIHYICNNIQEICSWHFSACICVPENKKIKDPLKRYLPSKSPWVKLYGRSFETTP